MRKRLGDQLISSSIITEEQLQIALKEQKKSGELLGAILFSLGFITQKELLTVLSASYSGDTSQEKQEEIALPSDISDIVRQSESALKRADRAPDKIKELSMAPVVRLLEKIISLGVGKGATDIHIGPDTKGTRVRYRIDGRLQHGMYLPKSVLAALVSRIKIMGLLNIAENRVPQDGATEFFVGGKPYDLRISTFPIAGGENVVLRILDKSQLLLGLENLGFGREDIEILNLTLNLPYGMVLVTGPTGSGKTTTLYSALSIINTVHKNIFTIEDPIEYQLPLIRQAQVNVKAGLTFASGLRSILRQDPDVILVGEMRDFETAELAIRSSLTGHFVFSTLHTNDAASSIPRLIDMGIEPFLLASTVDTVISQRLLRLLCTACREEYTPLPEFVESIGVPVPPNAVLYRAKGCEQCDETGYKGRTVVYEIMKMDETLRKLVLEKSGSDTLFKAALASGMKSTLENGVMKAVAGITSIEEVLSVTRTVN